MITRFRLEGMRCQHCVRAVFTALAAVEGIRRADVGLGWMEIDHDGVSLGALREAIGVVGYGVVEERRRLFVVEAENG
jgi:copper chaperone CopZ